MLSLHRNANGDADITVFDPERVIDRATYEAPARYSEGIKHVLVNGIFVVKDGQLQSGAAPGRAARSLGKRQLASLRRKRIAESSGRRGVERLYKCQYVKPGSWSWAYQWNLGSFSLALRLFWRFCRR